MDSFTHRYVAPLRKSVHRLGMAFTYGAGEKGAEAALERGLNYFFWTHLRTGGAKGPLQRALARKRDDVVVAAGPMLGFFGGSVRRGAEATLKELGVDYLDVFQLFWLGKTSAWTDSTIEALVRLREEGKVRAIGVSIHDRERAGALAKDSPLDLFMLRYNAAHPGAEKDVWPSLEGRGEARPAVVAYTATSWSKLLRRPSGWTGNVPTAGDCYRFCLSSPYVDVVLTGPANVRELEENVAALEAGPLLDDEMNQMRSFGKAVHG